MLEASSLWELIEARAAVTPDEIMSVDEQGRTITFAEYRVAAERAAAGFSALGVGTGDVVSWQLPTWLESLTLVGALSRLGAVQNPIIPIYRQREVGFCTRQAASQLLIVPSVWRNFDYEAMAKGLQESSGGAFETLVVGDDLPEGDPAILPAPPTDGDAVRWLYSTSGTTAAPKCVMHSDAGLIAGGMGLAYALEVEPDDVGSIAFPCTHIGGPDYFVVMLAFGMPAVLIEVFDPPNTVATFARHDVTMAGGSTAFYLAFLNEQRKDPSTPVMPKLRMMNGAVRRSRPRCSARCGPRCTSPCATATG